MIVAVTSYQRALCLTVVAFTGYESSPNVRAISNAIYKPNHLTTGFYKFRLKTSNTQNTVTNSC